MHRQSGRPHEHLWAKHLLRSRRGCDELPEAHDLRHVRIRACALPDPLRKSLHPLVPKVVMIVPPPLNAAAGGGRLALRLRRPGKGRIQWLQACRLRVSKVSMTSTRLQCVALGRGLHVLGILKGSVRALHDEPRVMGGQTVALGCVPQPQAAVQPPRPTLWTCSGCGAAPAVSARHCMGTSVTVVAVLRPRCPWSATRAAPSQVRAVQAGVTASYVWKHRSAASNAQTVSRPGGPSCAPPTAPSSASG